MLMKDGQRWAISSDANAMPKTMPKYFVRSPVSILSAIQVMVRPP